MNKLQETEARVAELERKYARQSWDISQLREQVLALSFLIEEKEKVTVVDTPNPTTKWGGKDNAKNG